MPNAPAVVRPVQSAVVAEQDDARRCWMEHQRMMVVVDAVPVDRRETLAAVGRAAQVHAAFVEDVVVNRVRDQEAPVRASVRIRRDARDLITLWSWRRRATEADRAENGGARAGDER